jgi:hypothetical protein
MCTSNELTILGRRVQLLELDEAVEDFAKVLSFKEVDSDEGKEIALVLPHLPTALEEGGNVLHLLECALQGRDIAKNSARIKCVEKARSDSNGAEPGTNQ